MIDLRPNTGDNCWPMLAGIGPLLGEGVCGYFTDRDLDNGLGVRGQRQKDLRGGGVAGCTSRARYWGGCGFGGGGYLVAGGAVDVHPGYWHPPVARHAVPAN